MKRLADQITRFGFANVRIIAGALALIIALDFFSAAQHAATNNPASFASGETGAPGYQPGPGAPDGSRPGGVSGPARAGQITSSITPSGSPTKGVLGYNPCSFVAGLGHIPCGVHGNKIDVVYYWKGDRSSASPYLGSTGQKGALDESDAFLRFVSYVNHFNKGGATFMGFPFNLHGYTIVPHIINAGEYPETWKGAANDIIALRPFAAESSHGGMSAYICPDLAKAGIFNPVTYNLWPGLVDQTNGWCLPQGLSWERQVELSVKYISEYLDKTPYQSPSGPLKRVYGLLYAEYDPPGSTGLSGAIPALKAKLAARGIHIAVTYSVPEGLADSASPSSQAVDAFQGHNPPVNTIIDPEGGAPITFTHAAASKAYTPDYYVWPCSGQDAVGQVRLFDPNQWSRARGLSCYDNHWNLDLTLDSTARASQWFAQYRLGAHYDGSDAANSNQDPPAMGPLVYQGMLPVLVGLTHATAGLFTEERFFEGLGLFHGYHYDGISGPTKDLQYFHLLGDQPDGSQIGDVSMVTWSNTAQTSPGAPAGAYIYSKRRYTPADSF
ncbi:MAG: hypothetical protein LC663_03790 [Actinobacteria bacterium]|nr:hypothetical protein [Actinomycetota bacterium]